MTAIAYDGKTLSADRAATSNEVRTPVNKISYLKGVNGEYIAALCGVACWIAKVELYFSSQHRETEFPDVTPHHENGLRQCFGFLIDVETGAVFSLSGCGTLIPEYGKILTAGYCYSFLHGVLATGASSKTAIALSQIYSDGSGMGVSTLDVEEFRTLAPDQRNLSSLMGMLKLMDPLEVAAHVCAIRPVE